MANANVIKGQLVEKGKNVDWLAIVLGCNRTTVYRKLNRMETMTVEDAAKIKKALNMTDEKAVEAFF